MRRRVSEVDVPIDFVVAYQIAIRVAIPAVLDIDLMGQKFHDPDWRGYEIVRSIRWQALEVAPANFHIVRESPGTASRVALDSFRRTHQIKPQSSNHTKSLSKLFVIVSSDQIGPPDFPSPSFFIRFS